MTTVVVRTESGKIHSVECDGHTGYGEEGEDIVCAALSSIVQTALLGLFGVAEVNVKVTRSDADGYLKMVLPSDMDEVQTDRAEVILRTMLLGIRDLHEGYSDFIELEVK